MDNSALESETFQIYCGVVLPLSKLLADSSKVYQKSRVEFTSDSIVKNTVGASQTLCTLPEKLLI